MPFTYKKLWKLLIDRGMNKAELCNKTSISRSTLNKLNSGKNVNADVLEKICEVLECDISDIVEYENKDYQIKKKNTLENEINNNLNNNHANSYISNCLSTDKMKLDELFDYYDKLNNETYHFVSRDDICTPMTLVKRMIDYIPNEFWSRSKLKILDPCCGNGNFGAYCRTKTSDDNIYYNEINQVRLKNCIKILNPKHYNCGDFFKLNGEFDTKFDLIMGNPPYSGGGNKNRSLANLFIEHSIDLLNNNGYLCFVTPNNWMTYNNNNNTLKKLLQEGSFIVIDNDVKKFFGTVGSSFTVIIWQKGVYNNKTKVINNFLIKDVKDNVTIPNDLNFIPLYLSNEVISIIKKVIVSTPNRFTYRCDLHNFTKKHLLSDNMDDVFKYRTIHTARTTRYAKIKQDIYNKWIIIIPLSTYYIPYIEHQVNTTQSVGYIPFDDKIEAKHYLNLISKPEFKIIVHLTRYGNFNNIMVLKHLDFDGSHNFTSKEIDEIKLISSKIKY